MLGFLDREMISRRDMNKISFNQLKSRDTMILYVVKRVGH